MALNSHALTFIITVVALQIVFIILFGLFVDYGEALAPHDLPANATEEEIAMLEDGGVGFFYPFFQDVNVMIFVGFGFLMTFLRKHGFGSVGFNFLIAAFVVQWSILVVGFWEQVSSSERWHTIELTIENLITADFAAGAVLISFGAVLGKFSPFALIYMSFFEVLFYGLNEWVGAREFQAVDMGGSMYVHTFGAFFGLAIAFVTQKKENKCHPLNSSVYHSDLFAMIGTIFLWIFWPSFNGALASGASQHRVVINTTLALTGSVLSAYVASIALRGGKFDMVDVQNATLAGGVAVGSSADLIIGPYSSMIVGALAGYVSVFGYVYISPALEKMGLQDTCGVLNLHGIPGIIGGVSGSISAAAAQESAYGQGIGAIFPARAPSNETLAALQGVDPGEDRTASSQAGFQIAALLVTLTVSIIGGALTGSLIRLAGDTAWGQPGSMAFQDKKYWETTDDYAVYGPNTKSDTKMELRTKTNGDGDDEELGSSSKTDS